jgi:hypothetical protein
MTPGASISSLMKTSPGAAAVAQDSLAATSIGSSAGGQAPMARKVLFEIFAAWCEEGDGEEAAVVMSMVCTAEPATCSQTYKLFFVAARLLCQQDLGNMQTRETACVCASQR